MHLRWRPAAPAIAVGLVALLGFAQPARASIGVGIQANPVTLAGAAHPGASYLLPSVYVVNTGTQAESMTTRIERLATGPGQTIPASWIHITSLGRQLQPRQSALISLELVTPSDAKPGHYVSDIVVTGSAGPASAGINFGAAAATDLTFRITPGPATGSWFSFPAWKWLLIGGLVLLAVIIGGWRRAGLRIRVERRGTADSGLNRSGGDHGA
jgi:hypothetical protein